MGCGGQDLRHLGSGFELGAIFELKPSLVPPFRGHARRGAVCSPLIVSRRPRAVGSSPRDGGGTSGLTPARFDLDVAPQSRLNLDALSTNTRWSLQTRAVRHDTRVPTLSEISRTPRIVSFGCHSHFGRLPAHRCVRRLLLTVVSSRERKSSLAQEAAGPARENPCGVRSGAAARCWRRGGRALKVDFTRAAALVARVMSDASKKEAKAQQTREQGSRRSRAGRADRRDLGRELRTEFGGTLERHR